MPEDTAFMPPTEASIAEDDENPGVFAAQPPAPGVGTDLARSRERAALTN